ncbi:APC family permease [Chryseobacterium sp. JJR-5R]|uniref:APC family permease n=1 Tax=Chryseobacterium sp. JJR-5R TaxID=3093923 RepID=UPI002A74A772|nr:APC family permease [Chryseobacterium sp. JJR-5R]WPO83468.1 APC family permease [Chryseobacterium sp. JJR-5R]
MELRINPFPKNNYPKKGLLIKGSSPLTWLHEMEVLGIVLSQVRSFPIPSLEPNVLYGCFLVFPDLALNEIGKNAYFQCVDNKLFIPENTDFYPKVNPEEWQSVETEFIVMHPDFGLVRLDEKIDWLSLIRSPEQTGNQVRKPLSGVKIPQNIERFTVEMDDEKVLEALQKPQTEEEWMKDLPFDLKKVMAGNKKEIEKYLKYIEKYPDRAVELGIPLDIMGTSRGSGFGKFKFFEKIGLGKLFAGNTSGGSFFYPAKYGWILWSIFIIVGVVWFSLYQIIESPASSGPASSGKISEIDKNMMSPVVGYQSGVTDIDMKIDSLYGSERRNLLNEHQRAASWYKDSDHKNSYEEYLKNGGRPIEKISEEIDRVAQEIKNSEDSLKKVYHKKIVKYLVQNEEKYRKKIADSLSSVSSGKPADEGIVKHIWKKRQVLIEDSLGRLYGTKEYQDPPFKPDEAGKVRTFEKEDSGTKHDILEIIFLIVLMTGIVGLYSYFVKRKTLNIGGRNVPGRTKAILILILTAMLVYLFYPLIEMFGYNWFVWVLVICVVLLLYRLFSDDKTILKSDKDE